MQYYRNPILLSSMATIQYVSVPFLSLGSGTARLNPKLSTYPIARKINLVGQTKPIILVCMIGYFCKSLRIIHLVWPTRLVVLSMGAVLSFGFDLAVSFPSDRRGSKARIV